MGRINFKDHALIKRQQACTKKNAMAGMFKDKKKQGNRQKQFAFIVGSCTCF